LLFNWLILVMTECMVERNKRSSFLTIIILVVIVITGIVGAFLSLRSTEFVYLLLPGGTTYVFGGAIYEIVFVLLTLATDVLYIFGGLIIAFGAVLVIYRFLDCKLHDPYKPSCSTRYLSGYLTLSLEVFIGAEIIRTVVIRTYEEFSLLILVILSRGLFSLILYLERRWHGSAETE
jgi:uncharacterized membrane protein